MGANSDATRLATAAESLCAPARSTGSAMNIPKEAYS